MHKCTHGDKLWTHGATTYLLKCQSNLIFTVIITLNYTSNDLLFTPTPSTKVVMKTQVKIRLIMMVI